MKIEENGKKGCTIHVRRILMDIRRWLLEGPGRINVSGGDNEKREAGW